MGRHKPDAESIVGDLSVSITYCSTDSSSEKGDVVLLDDDSVMDLYNISFDEF